jgi:hypothetical protein
MRIKRHEVERSSDEIEARVCHGERSKRGRRV